MVKNNVDGVYFVDLCVDEIVIKFEELIYLDVIFKGL